MKLSCVIVALFFTCTFGAPNYKYGLKKKDSDLISWDAISSDIESILDSDFAAYISQPATSVSKVITMSFFEKVLNTFFASHPECQDTFLIDYTTSNFYNHLITYTDGNIALTIETTIDNFDIEIPEDFDDALETLDETLQKPVYDLLDVIDDLELEPAWELTKELRGFIHSSANAGLTYKDAMMTVTEKIVKWFEDNVEKCSADESTYGEIAATMADDATEMSQAETESQIETIMSSDFAKMEETDVQLIEVSLTRAKFMRNLIWSKLMSAMQAGRTMTQSGASKSIGAVLHVGGISKKRSLKRSTKRSKNRASRKVLRELIEALKHL